MDGGHPGQLNCMDAVGLVVRLYDRGPADGRLGEPLLLVDSEVAHGGTGIFGSEKEAEQYRDRLRDAHLAAGRAREQLVEERCKGLPDLGHECIAAEALALAEASAARSRAKAATERHKKLTGDARDPQVLVNCQPRGEGWTVQAALCETEGQTGEPRALASLGGTQPGKGRAAKSKGRATIDEQLEATLEAGGGEEGARDCRGDVLKVGSQVSWAPEGEEGPIVGQVESIVPLAGGGWSITFEDSAAIPHTCQADELERVEQTEGWPEEPG